MQRSVKDSKINILIAYPYMNAGSVKFLDEHQDKFRFVLDSGAFTAWKVGKYIGLDDYCQYIRSLPFAPWQYFTLDVIGDAEKTLANYNIMRERGFSPIPIFTRGEKLEMLNEYYKTSDIVALGGLVGTQGNKAFVNGLMKHIGNRKCHWLGFTSIDYLKAYKPYMCDSSSWKSSRRYGDTALYMGNAKFIALRKKNFLQRPPKEITDRLAYLGFKAEALAATDEWHGGVTTSSFIATCSWIMFMMDVRNKLGTQLFLASSGEADLKIILNCRNHLAQQGLL